MQEGIRDLRLVNYCNPNCIPLQSITRLSRQEAFRKAEELATQFSGTSFGRFADFENYCPRRVHTEKWLHRRFVALGGEPRTKHPLYFVLQGSDCLDDWFDNGVVTQLPLEKIGRRHISFTYGDSCAQMGTPGQSPPFLVETLRERIARSGNVQQFLDDIRRQYAYIEAQLWSDEYL